METTQFKRQGRAIQTLNSALSARLNFSSTFR